MLGKVLGQGEVVEKFVAAKLDQPAIMPPLGDLEMLEPIVVCMPCRVDVGDLPELGGAQRGVEVIPDR